ncbi:MAG: hypothetical protein COA44_06100 [Arcobacter sp.]|nr:MAG: hypothetical protein COA44_06100 [Arcobacter sp.]
MALAKDPFFYKITHQAIEAFGERHNITARQYFAQLLGYKGPNSNIQIGTMLNYNTYNPLTPRPMSVDQLLVVMDECEDDRQIIIDAICKRFGGQFVKDKTVTKAADKCIKDDLMKLSFMTGNLSNLFLQYMKDGVLDVEEGQDLESKGHEIRQEMKNIENYFKSIKQD